MKMNGIVKWYKPNKGYGYIKGSDEETYFFEKIDCLNQLEEFNTGDKVLFLPEFLELDCAKEVEKVS